MSSDRNRRIYTIGGLARGLKLLEALAEQGKPMKLAEIAKRLDLTRGVTFRLIYTLKDAGYLEEVGDKIYQTGPRVLGLGFAYLRAQGLVRLARAHLEALCEATGSTVFLAVRDGAEIVYLDKIKARGQATLDLDIGDRVPAHAAAMGRVLLADVPESELDRLYGASAVPAFRHQPERSLADLKAELALIRQRGYAASYSTLYKGIASIAAPVRGADGRAAASINCTVLEGSVDRATLEGPMRARLLEAATAISRALGYTGFPDIEHS